MKSLKSVPQRFTNSFFKNFFCPRSDIRRLLYFLSFVFILTPSLAGAAQVSLAWDESTGPDVAGYKMYYGNYSGNYQYTVDVGNSTSCTISGLEEGKTYYFAVTAYNSLESDYSKELAYTIPNTPPPPLLQYDVIVGTISKSGWSLLYVDSEELVGEDDAAVNAFDGDPATIWLTEWLRRDPLHPHEIQIDLWGYI